MTRPNREFADGVATMEINQLSPNRAEKESGMKFVWRILLLQLFLSQLGSSAFAQENRRERYFVQPGDILEISVWKEVDLHREALVRPDGRFSFPLVGDIDGTDRTVEELQFEVVQRLEKYIPNPVVTVTVKNILGNKIYVIGQVNGSGEFVVNPRVDVMQALSLAGGTTPFAALNEIVILRRELDGTQRAMKFQYKNVARGRDLDQNIILLSGDTVVVP